MKFQKATVSGLTVRCAIVGPPGAGKTYGALLMARGLAGEKGKIAVVDTERGRSKAYARTIGFSYDVLPLTPPHSPERYREALQLAVKEGYSVVVLDSLSHEWMGEGGVLQQVDNSHEKNKFAAWRDPSKAHTAVLEAIVGSPIDVVVTVRSKIAYEVQDQGGRKVPVRIGLAPVQREGVEYEFDLVLEVSQDTHEARIQKCNAGYHSAVLEALARSPQISKDIGGSISAWRSEVEGSGDYVPEPPQEPPAPVETPAPAAKASRAKPAKAKPAEAPASPAPAGNAVAVQPAASAAPSATPVAAATASTPQEAAKPAPPDEVPASHAVTDNGPYTVDDSVYDIAEVPGELAAEIKATSRDDEVDTALWTRVHEWLLEAVGGPKKKKDAMAHWMAVGVEPGGEAPIGSQIQQLVFNMAGVKLTNPAKKES